MTFRTAIGLLRGALLGLALALMALPAQAGGARATVVELFTSQGCNACPPADALLGQLAGREQLIALTFNVDYWDYLGWRDTLASGANTQRQKDYARRLGRRGVYTPQVVVGGRLDVVGSDRPAIESAISRDRARDDPALDVYFTARDDMVLVQITGAAYANEATIWLVRFDDRHEIEIARGENAGRTLNYYNVVRDYKSLGLWRGHAMEIALGRDDLLRDGADGCAVIVQLGRNGPIIGAGKMAF